MTAKQAANRIFAGIVKLADENREEAASAKRAGADKISKEFEIAADTLCCVAAGLNAAIEEGEFD